LNFAAKGSSASAYREINIHNLMLKIGVAEIPLAALRAMELTLLKETSLTLTVRRQASFSSLSDR